MSYIHFKTVYNNNYDKLTFDGVNLTLSQVKKMIFEKSTFKVNKQIDFDLEITNADTNEVYRSENDSIVKNTRLLVKRVVRNSAAPLRAQPPKITTQTAYQNAQTAATATNTTAASAAASFSTTSTGAVSLNLTNNTYLSTQSSNTVSNNSNPVIQQKKASNNVKPMLCQPPVNITETAKNLGPIQCSTVISQDSIEMVENVTNSSAAPLDVKTLTTSITSNIKTTIESLPKAVYDSLAPLNLPSKPIFYTDEKQNIEKTNSQNEPSSLAITVSNSPDAIASIGKNIESASSMTIVEKEKADVSRLDEKAKLESILFNSMSQTSSSYQQKGVHLGSISDNTSLSLNNLNKPNRYGLNLGGAANNVNAIGTNINSWNANANSLHLIHQQLPSQFNMPRLHPGYLCSICRKPGHAKSFCPEAGTIKHTDFIKTPKGIPRSFQLPADPGHKFAMRGPDGGFVVSEIEHKAAQIVKKDKQIFLDDDENKKSDDDETQSENENIQNLNSKMIPSELKCPYGDHIIRDAVLVPCCGHFVCCDECIRQKISNDGIEEIECPHEGCDIGSLGSITPFHEIRKKVSEYLNSLKSSNNRLNTNQSQTANDPFFDLILSDVKSEKTAIETLNRNSKSPLQDSKISSSEALLSLNAANNSSVNQIKQNENISITKASGEAKISLDSKNITAFQQSQLSVESHPISNIINTPLSANSEADSGHPSNKINQSITYNPNPIPSSNYNINQQANQYLPFKTQTQSFNLNMNQQNFTTHQLQTNMNFSRNNQMNSNQSFVDNYQQQKQIQNNRMGMQTTLNVSNNMFNNMNNNACFVNTQQKLSINQQRLPLQAQSDPIFNQFDQQNQHNIPFNANNNLNQYQSHSFHQQHANININQNLYPQNQSINVMNQSQMQLQSNSFDPFNNINVGLTGQQHTSSLLPGVNSHNPSIGQHLISSVGTGLSNIMFDGNQQSSQYLPKNDMLLNNLNPNFKSKSSNLITEPISTNIISAPISSTISNIPIFPIDGIMTEAQFYQYQERLRKERELNEMARSEHGHYSTYKSYEKSDSNQRLIKRRYSRSKSRSYSRTRSSYSRSKTRSFSRSPSRSRTRASPLKHTRKRSYTRTRSRTPYSSRSNSPTYRKTNVNEKQGNKKTFNNYQRNRSKSRTPSKRYPQVQQKGNQSSYQQIDSAENYKPSYNNHYQTHQQYTRNNRKNFNSSTQRSRSRSKGKSTSASLLSRISGKSNTLLSSNIDYNLQVDKGHSQRSSYNRSRSRSPNKNNSQALESFHSIKHSNINLSNQDHTQSLELSSTVALYKSNKSDEVSEGKLLDLQKKEAIDVNLNTFIINENEIIRTAKESTEKVKIEKKDKKKKNHKRDKSDKREKSKKEDNEKKNNLNEEKDEKTIVVQQQLLKSPFNTTTATISDSIENANAPIENIKKQSSNMKIKLSRSNGEKRRSNTNLLVVMEDKNEIKLSNAKFSGKSDEKNINDNIEEIEKVSKKKKTNNLIEPATIITTTTLNEILNKETDNEKKSSKKEKSKDKKSKHKSKKKKHKHKHRSSSASKTIATKSCSK